MRLLIASVIALIAVTASAAAQHLDARRSVGGIDEGRAYCRFAAYPDLMLEYQVDRSAVSATWQSAAREADNRAARFINLIVMFAPSGGDAISALVPMLWVRMDHEAFPRQIASARVVVDGKDAKVPLRIEGTMRMDPGSTNTLSFVPGTDDGVRLAGLLLVASTAQLDLLDDQGTIVRSYHWNVRKLRDAPIVLAQAKWECGNAVYR